MRVAGSSHLTIEEKLERWDLVPRQIVVDVGVHVFPRPVFGLF